MDVMPAHYSRLALPLLTALLLCGCWPKSNEAPKKEPGDDAAALRDAAVRESSESFLKALPTLLTADAERRAVSEVPTLQAALAPKDGLLGPLEVRHPKITRDLYGKRELTSRWISNTGVFSKQGKLWLAILDEVEPLHGIFAHDVRLPLIQRHLKRLQKPPLEAPSLELSAAQKKSLDTWFSENADSFQGEDANAKILDAVIAKGLPLEALASARDEIIQDRIARARAAVEVEILMTDALARYARRMKLDNPAWFKDRAWNADLVMPEGARKKERARIEAARLEALILETLGPIFEDKKQVDEVAAQLIPPFEQYRRLTEAHKRYAKLLAEGGWKPLPPEVGGLKSGDSKPEVKLLKERLRAEGFWGEEDSEAYGPKLTAAVKLYQHTHQIWEKGFITDETLRSMNVPVERRFWRIRQSLERWRQTRIGADRDYIFVNIPDFHTEVWEDGERAMRFKVVTGSARREYDPETREQVMPRSTNLFSDTMEYIVFNPYWNVPKGITENEILPKLEENPDYLEENNYEWYETSAGNRILRQTPGEHNALGLVKFLFPNKHDIYLHDTNEKGFFRYPIRAFSHGCMRVHEPMKLAEYLLKREGKWDEKRGVKRWMQGGGETWIKLENPLAVHIEYVVARVDDDGHTHFLADVYRLDHEPMTRMSASSIAYDILDRATRATSPTEIASKDAGEETGSPTRPL